VVNPITDNSIDWGKGILRNTKRAIKMINGTKIISQIRIKNIRFPALCSFLRIRCVPRDRPKRHRAKSVIWEKVDSVSGFIKLRK
jgi:hypothetical protein